MAIAIDNSAISQNNGATSSLTYSHTIASNSLGIILVFVSNWVSTSSPSATGVTWNGVALTRYGGVLSAAGDRFDLWYLLAPATGTHSVVISFAASQEISGCSVSLTGVDQTTPLGTLASNSSNPAARPTTALTITSSASTDLVLAAVGIDTLGAGTITVNSGGFTMLQQNGGASPDTQGVAVSDHVGTGANLSTNFTWANAVNNSWSQIGVAVLVSSGGTPVTMGWEPRGEQQPRFDKTGVVAA